jgi:hypothetical protein
MESKKYTSLEYSVDKNRLEFLYDGIFTISDHFGS